VQNESQEDEAGSKGTEENTGQGIRSMKINTDSPTLDEVKTVIKQLKDRKAPGFSNIPPNILTADVDTTAKLLHFLMVLIWKEKKYPNDWNKGIVNKLPRKGDLSNCNNWRGIALLPIVSEMFSRIMLSRIQGPVDKVIRKEEAGFRASISCIDHINTLRIIIEQSMEWKTGLRVTFIDFEKAFNSLNRKKICRILKEYGILHKIINLIKEMYQDSTFLILLEGALSKPIAANSGVKQGCALSPTIFVIVMDYMIKMVTANKRRGIIWKLTEGLENLDYADDICVLSQSYKDMREKLEDLNKEAVKVGLKMNASKTKAMKINSKTKTKYEVNGNIIDETEKFQYLGSLVKIDGGAEEDVKNSIS
jgi:hypothetical protein